VDSFTRGAQIKSRATGDSWEFSFGTRELAVRGISRMGKSVQTRARDPEGEARDCITSPWSSLTLEVDDLIHATKKTFVTSSNAILERGCRSESRP